jgi:hypothetical protein
MKKSTFGILATIALAFSPVAAFAQDAQTSVQSNTNSAAAVGHGNAVIQNADQYSDQTQVDVGGYGYDAPDAQLSIQGNTNEAAAIGEGNLIHQNADQTSGQTQVDAGAYYPGY